MSNFTFSSILQHKQAEEKKLFGYLAGWQTEIAYVMQIVVK